MASPVKSGPEKGNPWSKSPMDTLKKRNDAIAANYAMEAGKRKDPEILAIVGNDPGGQRYNTGYAFGGTGSEYLRSASWRTDYTASDNWRAAYDNEVANRAKKTITAPTTTGGGQGQDQQQQDKANEDNRGKFGFSQTQLSSGDKENSQKTILGEDEEDKRRSRTVLGGL